MDQATAHVGDVPGGIALTLRVRGSEVDVLTLRDFVVHLVDAWNVAEQGIVGRCFPRVRAGAAPIGSTAESTLVNGGIEVVFKPLDPRELKPLRAHVRAARALTLSCVGPP